jgi:1-acyl-sn-glycerol-3-phosphate acyltransferase
LLAINQGAENLKKGISMVIFPEGTRSKDGILGDFKPGSLKLAIKAGAPVIPVTLNGSVNILPKKGFIIRPTEVKIIISPPVVLEKALQKDSNALAEAVRNIIQENLKNY